MNPDKRFFAFCALIILLASSSPAWPAGLGDEIGKVVAARGRVMAYNDNGTSRALEINSPVHRGDTIKTGKTSRLQIMFLDQTLISIGRGSDLKLSEYEWSPKDGKGTMKTRVKEGTFRVMGGAITRNSPENFKTETPNATIGIRGSMYAGKVSDEGLSVVFQAGTGINVSNSAGTVEISKPGFGTLVQAQDIRPVAPFRFSSDQIGGLTDDLLPPAETGAEPETPSDSGSEQAGTGEPAADSGETADTSAGGETQSTQEQQAAAPAGEGEPVEGVTERNPEEGSAPPVGTATTASGTTPDTGDSVFGSDAPVSTLGQAPKTQSIGGTYDASLSGSLTSIRDTVSTATLELSSGSIDNKATSIPLDGLFHYSGTISGFANNAEGVESIVGDMFMGVNWHSHKAMGIVFDTSEISQQGPSPPVFFFGDVVGSGLQNVRIVGSGGGGPDHPITALTGQGFGEFFGPGYQFFDADVFGREYNLANPAAAVTGDWAVYVTSRQDGVDPQLPKRGVQTWNGFVAGIGENMNNPSVARKRFVNSLSSQVQFVVDRDRGTLDGSITARDVDGTVGDGITNLKVGGTLGSAYISDTAMVAMLGCPGCITANGLSAGTKPAGNYMFTEKEDGQFATYATWGFWEMAHEDPATLAQYHTHLPYSTWIAGERTPSGFISGLLGTNFTATYNGGATGTMIDAGGMVHHMGWGTSAIAVNFLTSTVNGTLNFNTPNVAATLGFAGAGGTVTPFGYSTTIAGAGTSQVTGAFFGPRAESTGGNFSAVIGSTTYTGIFGGDRM